MEYGASSQRLEVVPIFLDIKSTRFDGAFCAELCRLCHCAGSGIRSVLVSQYCFAALLGMHDIGTHSVNRAHLTSQHFQASSVLWWNTMATDLACQFFEE
ncbi:unnamed protein product [Durusdinium trenchii]|uniref:Uncharacterized protein n=1 Tax=Durusdinium trenchii TaxID=1381693 RepID=A0ABP0Q6D2_9DINO